MCNECDGNERKCRCTGLERMDVCVAGERGGEAGSVMRRKEGCTEERVFV